MPMYAAKSMKRRKELAGMLGDLTGNARDLAGLEKLKALLGGE